MSAMISSNICIACFVEAVARESFDDRNFMSQLPRDQAVLPRRGLIE